VVSGSAVGGAWGGGVEAVGKEVFAAAAVFVGAVGGGGGGVEGGVFCICMITWEVRRRSDKTTTLGRRCSVRLAI